MRTIRLRGKMDIETRSWKGNPMSRSRNTDPYIRPEPSPADVQAIQDLRKGSRTRPFGSLRGRNRQNERRAAIVRSEEDSR